MLGLVSAAAGIALFVYRLKTAGPADPPFVKEQNGVPAAAAAEAAPEEQGGTVTAEAVEAAPEERSETVTAAVEAAAAEETKEENHDGGDDS